MPLRELRIKLKDGEFGRVVDDVSDEQDADADDEDADDEIEEDEAA